MTFSKLSPRGGRHFERIFCNPSSNSITILPNYAFSPFKTQQAGFFDIHTATVYLLQPEFRKGAIVKSKGILQVVFDGAVVIGYGSTVITQLVFQKTTIIIGLCLPGIEFNGFVIIGYGIAGIS